MNQNLLSLFFFLEHLLLQSSYSVLHFLGFNLQLLCITGSKLLDSPYIDRREWKLQQQIKKNKFLLPFTHSHQCQRAKRSRLDKFCLCSLPPSWYPASSWFLLRQMREKPLRATVCFSIEHAQARHASRNAFDAKFIFQ